MTDSDYSSAIHHDGFGVPFSYIVADGATRWFPLLFSSATGELLVAGSDAPRNILDLLTERLFLAVDKKNQAEWGRFHHACVTQFKITRLDSCDYVAHRQCCWCFVVIC